jgi:hypothetical protein
MGIGEIGDDARADGTDQSFYVPRIIGRKISQQAFDTPGIANDPIPILDHDFCQGLAYVVVHRYLEVGYRL